MIYFLMAKVSWRRESDPEMAVQATAMSALVACFFTEKRTRHQRFPVVGKPYVSSGAAASKLCVGKETEVGFLVFTSAIAKETKQARTGEFGSLPNAAVAL